jgi:hypothetical protein
VVLVAVVVGDEVEEVEEVKAKVEQVQQEL